MYCVKCGSVFCECKKDSGAIAPFRTEPLLFETPIFERRPIMKDRLLSPVPIFRPIGMDAAEWCLMPTSPGFIKF